SEVSGHQRLVSSVAFSPDGRWLASGSEDRVCLTNLEKQEQLHLLPTAAPPVAFSPDGRRLATAGPDATVSLWDVARLELAQSLRCEAAVRCLAFSPDGRHLAGAAGSRAIQVWDLAAGAGRERLGLRGHTGDINCIAFAPDGATLASASED